MDFTNDLILNNNNDIIIDMNGNILIDDLIIEGPKDRINIIIDMDENVNDDHESDYSDEQPKNNWIIKLYCMLSCCGYDIEYEYIN